ncbi:MAG TPA: hypothetical protein VIY52_05580 [Streptosporangiaceae bacterium]
MLDHLALPQLIQAGAEVADVRHDAGDGVRAGTGAVIRATAGAARLAMLVAVGDLPRVPAGSTRFGGTTSAAVARGADPEFAVALDQPLGLAAVRAARQYQPLGARSQQYPDQQFDLGRALRVPGGEQPGIAGQRAGQTPLLRPGRSDRRDRGGDDGLSDIGTA